MPIVIGSTSSERISWTMVLLQGAFLKHVAPAVAIRDEGDGLVLTSFRRGPPGLMRDCLRSMGRGRQAGSDGSGHVAGLVFA